MLLNYQQQSLQNSIYDIAFESFYWLLESVFSNPQITFLQAILFSLLQNLQNL